MSDYTMIITSTDSKEIAISIQSTLIKEKISPCIQLIDSVSSMYEWNNNIIKDEEYLLLIKTAAKNIENVKLKIVELHNYDNPEIISLNFDILTKNYASWFNAFYNKVK